MKLEFERIHRKWKNIDNQILIFFFIKLFDKPEPGKKLLQGSASHLLNQGSPDVLHYEPFVKPWKVKLPISCKTLVDEHEGIKVTDGENDFEQNGVLELRLVRNQELGYYDKGWFSDPESDPGL